MDLASKVSIPKEVMSRQVGDELVILDLASGMYFGLDAIGTRIWQLVEAGKPLGEVCEVMTGEYDVSRDQMQQDLDNLLAELHARGLVHRVT
jgi:hypothetical protein